MVNVFCLSTITSVAIRSVVRTLVQPSMAVLIVILLVSDAVLYFIGKVAEDVLIVQTVVGLCPMSLCQRPMLERELFETPVLVVAEPSGVLIITNGRVEKRSGLSTKAITVDVVSVYGKRLVWFVMGQIDYKSITLTEIPRTVDKKTLFHCVIAATGRFIKIKNFLLSSLSRIYSLSGQMAEVKSRRKSGTLQRESEVKDNFKRLTSRNDYQLILRKQTIMLARGRDSSIRAEKIVWTVAKQKLQIRWIKSQRDNNSIPYGRGAAALAREIVKSTQGKLSCDRDKAQQYIDGFFKEYPEVKDFIDRCKKSVITPGYLPNPFGRRRRATPSDDQVHISAQQREFVNFPIQGTVADALNTALVNFYYYRKEYPDKARYRILLAIHDAVLLECKPEYLDVVVNEVIPTCMTHACIIPSWQPGPDWPVTKPFKLETDIEVGVRWQEHPTVEELKALNVSEHWIEKLVK